MYVMFLLNNYVSYLYLTRRLGHATIVSKLFWIRNCSYSQLTFDIFNVFRDPPMLRYNDLMA